MITGNQTTQGDQTMIKLTTRQSQALAKKIRAAKNPTEVQSVTTAFYARLEALQRAKHFRYAEKLSKSKQRTNVKIKELIGTKSNIGDFILTLNRMTETHIKNTFNITLCELRDILNEVLPRC